MLRAAEICALHICNLRQFNQLLAVILQSSAGENTRRDFFVFAVAPHHKLDLTILLSDALMLCVH